MFKKVKIGDTIRGKKVKDIVNLSNGWQVVKTENGKSPHDFKVKIINPTHPIGLTIKHAHFAIDFYGKICQDKVKALTVFEALVKVWQGEDIKKVMEKYESQTYNLSGYSLEYILYSLNWILEQEDINFEGRPIKKQKELDYKLEKGGVKTPKEKKGSQLAIALFCDIASGIHPVESFYGTGLRI